MSDDLDDGEIPKETILKQLPGSNHPDLPSHDQHPQSAARSRYNNRKSPDYSRRSSSRSRSAYRSPAREDPYDRRRPRSPRDFDRYPSDSVASRSRPHNTRREPSVRDANTRADLGRLAREAEAAAYKARNAAANKTTTIVDKRSGISGSSSPRRKESIAHSEKTDTVLRRRSRSPRANIATQDDRTRQSPSRPSGGHHSSSARSPSQHRKPALQVRVPSSEAIRPSPSVRRSLTAADIGRLEREKEAAAYKAQVLADAKTQARAVESISIGKSPAQLERRSTATSVQEHHVTSTERAQERPAEKAEVVRHVRSVCSKIDSQLAILKKEFEALLKEDLQKQAEMRMCKRRWSMLERESQREAYKSELAQLSLEATSAM